MFFIYENDFAEGLSGEWAGAFSGVSSIKLKGGARGSSQFLGNVTASQFLGFWAEVSNGRHNIALLRAFVANNATYVAQFTTAVAHYETHLANYETSLTNYDSSLANFETPLANFDT